MADERYYTSGELTRAAGCTRKALRVYQAKGLIKPDRNTGNRRYRAEAFERLRFIVAMRDLGLSVDKIGEILEARDAPGARGGAVAHKLAAEVGDLIPQITDKIQHLLRVRNQLVVARETLLSCAPCSNPIESCAHCAEAGALDTMSELLLVGQ
ncbi:MAG: MerR family transcriptional regulator [Deltaproteobacteria bacterium]|nr:MAG: MerR family transcriptional regulator [Deltaproteobacteria bacterium]